MANGFVDMRMGCGSGLLYENFGWWVVASLVTNLILGGYVEKGGIWWLVYGSQCLGTCLLTLSPQYCCGAYREVGVCDLGGEIRL